MKKALIALLVAAAAYGCTHEEPMTPVTPPSGDFMDVSTPDGDNIIPGWVRIKLTDDSEELRTGAFTRGAVSTGNEQLDEIAEMLGATEVRRVFSDGGKYAERRRKYGLHLWYDIKLGEDVPVSRAEAGMRTLPGVRYAIPLYRMIPSDASIVPDMAAELRYQPAMKAAVAIDAARPEVEAPFNDESLDLQWHYYNTGTIEGSAEGADINLYAAWEQTAGDPSVIVAVLDSGVQVDHPDLAANMWVNPGEIPGNGEDDDNNGYVDDIYGYNFALKQGEIVPYDHGTHVAGTIAAVNNNGIGVCGVAGGTGKGDGARIMSLQWGTNNTATTMIPNYDMFAYAADNGAVIASCSWEVGSGPEYAPDLLDGIDYFIDNAGMDETGTTQVGPMKGGVVIFAAGNANQNKLEFPVYYERVISVAAMAANYDRASYTNYAPEVGILAPGGESAPENLGIYSTITKGRYGYMDGTSMATPHVSGIAALIASKFGGQGFTNEQLKEKLLAGVRPISPIVSDQYSNQIGVGLVDAAMVLSDMSNPKVAPGKLEDFGATGRPDSLVIYCKVPADGNDMPVTKYLLQYAEKKDGAVGEWHDLTLINTEEIGATYEYGFELVELTTYALKMKPVDRWGNEGDEVTFEGTTEKHTNRPPVQKARLLNLTIPEAGADNVKRFRLENYFKDPDVGKYGDELSYKVTSSNEAVVATEIDAENVLSVMPLKAGESTVTVRALDTEGAYLDVPFTVTVQGGWWNHAPELAKEFGAVEIERVGEQLTFALSEYFSDADVAEGDKLTYRVVSTEGNAVEGKISDGELVVRAVNRGEGKLTISATDKADETVEAVMTVTVKNGAGDASKLSFALNPVSDELNISAVGVGDETLKVTIYDNAARKVKEGNVDFKSGSATFYVGDLSAGSYICVVNASSGRLSGGFMKR